MFEQMPFSEKYPVFRKLAEIGDLRKLSREELELYDEDIKNMRDIYATRKFDEKRGMEKGMAKGMEKEKLATAHRAFYQWAFQMSKYQLSPSFR